MFKFFKNKLKGALDKINKKVEEEVPDEKVEDVQEIVEDKKKKVEKPRKKKEIKRLYSTIQVSYGPDCLFAYRSLSCQFYYLLHILHYLE